MFDRLFVWMQYLLPQHLLSRVIGRLADTEISWLKDLLIRNFARTYQVEMAEAAQPDLSAYPSFNAFFTRPLKENAREIDSDTGVLVSPADGAVSQLGDKIGRAHV